MINFFGFELCIIALLLKLISFFVHFDKQILHPLQVSFLHVELDLERLASFIDTIIFGLLQSVKLTKMALFSLNLLLA